jgi:hypothetical protein
MFEENLPSPTSFVASSHEHRTVRPAATPRQPNPPVFTQTRTGGRAVSGREGPARRGCAGEAKAGVGRGGDQGRSGSAGSGIGRGEGAGGRARVRMREAGGTAPEGTRLRSGTVGIREGGGRWDRGGRGEGTTHRPPRPPGPLSAAPRRRASTTHHSLRARAPTAATRCSNLTCRSLGQRCFNGGSA